MSSPTSPTSSSSSSSSSSGRSSPSIPRKRKRDSDSEETSAGSESESDNPHDVEIIQPSVNVMSHAERRRQKKKQAKENQGLSSADNEPKQLGRRRSKIGPNPSSTTSNTSTTTRRQNSVWVGNLSFKTTPESLRAFFADGGEITRIHMPMKPSSAGGGGPGRSENRGFAYVDFSTAEAKMAAIAKSEQPLIGRRLLIKDGGDFTGRPVVTPAPAPASPEDKKDGDDEEEENPQATLPPQSSHTKTGQKILRAQNKPPAPTLFFGNLGFGATEASIREMLDAHRVKEKPKKRGNKRVRASDVAEEQWIRKVRMGTFQDSGLCKGFAFVDFTSVQHATSALTNPKNYSLDGRQLVVEYASAEAVRRGGGGAQAKKWSQKRTGETKRRDESTRRREEPTRPRPKPGASLALAKRESAAIIPSGQGQKIKFE